MNEVKLLSAEKKNSHLKNRNNKTGEKHQQSITTKNRVNAIAEIKREKFTTDMQL